MSPTRYVYNYRDVLGNFTPNVITLISCGNSDTIYFYGTAQLNNTYKQHKAVKNDTSKIHYNPIYLKLASTNNNSTNKHGGVPK